MSKVRLALWIDSRDWSPEVHPWILTGWMQGEDTTGRRVAAGQGQGRFKGGRVRR